MRKQLKLSESLAERLSESRLKARHNPEATVCQLNADEILKLEAAVWHADVKTPQEMERLTQVLRLFHFMPGVQTKAAY